MIGRLPSRNYSPRTKFFATPLELFGAISFSDIIIDKHIDDYSMLFHGKYQLVRMLSPHAELLRKKPLT